MTNKPLVFNYQEHVKTLERIEELEAEVEYWKEVANQQRIKIRILEGDKDNGSEV